jgi:protein-S-isoprenylcysteine O-methyltransferase Ste14
LELPQWRWASTSSSRSYTIFGAAVPATTDDSESQWPFWATFGAVLTLGGLLFMVWARIYLGRNWSGVAALKADQELVTSGP